MRSVHKLKGIAVSVTLGLCGLAISAGVQAPNIQLPDKPDAVRFAVIGDNGTGERPEYEVAEEMMRAHQSFPFGFVLMMGDNLYGGKSPSDYKRKFEQPYKGLLDQGVKFYACLGNHDDPNERFYQLFNMDGQRYYTLRKGEVQFFALDSNYPDPAQSQWIEKELADSHARWKICFFHHPLYSTAHFHGPDLPLKNAWEPIFKKYGVNVVLNGHEHVYERLKPQGGITYFVLGNSGQLRPHDLRPSSDVAKGFDTDQSFMLMEIAGDELYYQTFSRSGETVDAGEITRHS